MSVSGFFIQIMAQQTTKIWKEKPPGAEQLLLEEMFETGSITDYATTETVRQSSELFKAFPPRIFAVHFRKTKGKMGEFRTVEIFNFLIL